MPSPPASTPTGYLSRNRMHDLTQPGAPKLRLLHIHTFYPQSLESLYEAFPPLKSSSFSAQTQAILDAGFSAAHIFTPYLSDLGYDSTFIVANNPYSQVKWLKENNIPLGPDEQTLHHILRKQIEHYRPDVLYFCDTIQFDTRFLSTLNHQAGLVMGWRGAEVSDKTDWSAYDVILSGLPRLLEVAKELGAKETAFFFPGYPTRINPVLETIRERYDVVFAGSCTPRQHHERNAYLNHVARYAVSPSGAYSCAFYLNGEVKKLPPVVQEYAHLPRFGLDMHKVLKSGRIVLDARGKINFFKGDQTHDLAGPDTVNMRLFEAIGGGSFLLTEYTENLNRYFKPGVELETFKTKEELVDKIQYYLLRPDERAEIARRGQERCMKEYNMEERARAFDRIIRTQWEKKHPSMSLSVPVSKSHSIPVQQIPSPSPINQEETMESLIRSAVNTYKEGQYASALHMASQAKAMNRPLMNIDYLRAACLLHLGHNGEACRALTEELLAFPHNEEAKKLFEKVSGTPFEATPVTDLP